MSTHLSNCPTHTTTPLEFILCGPDISKDLAAEILPYWTQRGTLKWEKIFEEYGDTEVWRALSENLDQYIDMTYAYTSYTRWLKKTRRSNMIRHMDLPTS